MMFNNMIVAAAAAVSPDAGAAAVVDAVRAAWLASDPAAMAEMFEAEGRLVIPSGKEMVGRKSISAFYAAAFGAGYSGSKGGGTVHRVTWLGSDVAYIEGDWSITDARDRSGATRPAESGQFGAVVRRSGGKWRIVALREMRLSG